MNKIKKYRWLIATVAFGLLFGTWAVAEYDVVGRFIDRLVDRVYVEDLKPIMPELTENLLAESEELNMGWASPDMMSTYIGVGGRREVWLSGSYIQASSTLCTFNPDFGTTTLATIGFQTTTGTTTATTIHVAKATASTQATTTNIRSVNVAATDLGTFLIVATSTANATPLLFDEDQTTWHITEDEVVNISVQGADGPLGDGDYTGNAMQGTCWAQFYVY